MSSCCYSGAICFRTCFRCSPPLVSLSNLIRLCITNCLLLRNSMVFSLCNSGVDALSSLADPTVPDVEGQGLTTRARTLESETCRSEPNYDVLGWVASGAQPRQLANTRFVRGLAWIILLTHGVSSRPGDYAGVLIGDELRCTVIEHPLFNWGSHCRCPTAITQPPFAQSIGRALASRLTTHSSSLASHPSVTTSTPHFLFRCPSPCPKPWRPRSTTSPVLSPQTP